MQAAMNLKEVLAIIVALTILVGVPAFMIWGVVDHVRNGRKRERRSTGGGIGGVLVELDRLVRPSVEHTVEAETRVLRREDDDGAPPS
jgi:hypothetical protein